MGNDKNERSLLLIVNIAITSERGKNSSGYHPHPKGITHITS